MIDALKLDYRLLYDNMEHVVGSVVMNAMVHAGRADRYSRRPKQKAECRVVFSYQHIPSSVYTVRDYANKDSSKAYFPLTMLPSVNNY